MSRVETMPAGPRGDGLAQPTVKDRARRVLTYLSDDVTWEEVLEEMFLHKQIELARQDYAAGRTFTQAEVFGGKGADPA